MKETLKAKKRKLEDIYQTTLAVLTPRKMVNEALKIENDLLHVGGRSFSYKKIIIAGFGKAACTMAQGMEDALPEEVYTGIVVTKYGHLKDLKKITAYEAGHPIPDENSIKATREIIRKVETADKDTVVLFLISGGGSALLESPVEGVSLEDLQKTTDVLLRCGANINEVNTIRKHLSMVKGGGLARLTYPAAFISLIMSDVIGSDLSSIASGPCVGDPTTFGDCLNVIEKYSLRKQLPKSVVETIEKGASGEIPDNPKPGDGVFKKGTNIILADNDTVCRHIVKAAKERGLEPHYIKTDAATGLAEEFIQELKEILAKYSRGEHESPLSPTLLVMGGEVTVMIPEGSPGLGGRNQHLALLYTREVLPEYMNSVALFASTDGNDGPTDAGGGFSHRDVFAKIGNDREMLNIAIRDFDSYHFLKEIDELLITGPTGNNLNDVFMIHL